MGLSITERLRLKKEKANAQSNTKPSIPFEKYHYLRGEVCTVKLHTCPLDGESMKMIYTSEFRYDVDGKPISIKYNDNVGTKVAYCSPKTDGGKDELLEYKSKQYKELAQEEAKKATEHLKNKQQAYCLAEFISHSDEKVQGTFKILPFNSHMIDFITDSMIPDPITETIEVNKSISVKNGKSIIADEYVVSSVADGVIVCNNTIDELSPTTELLIDGKVYTFTGILGNTFTGVSQKTYTEEDIFGTDSEYVLYLSPKVEDNGGGMIYNNYSAQSMFKHISEVNGLSSVKGSNKYSDIRDVNLIKEKVDFKLSEAGSKMQTYEQSYFKFHKHFLKKEDDVIKKELAQMKAGNDEVITEPKEEPKPEVAVESPKVEVKESKGKLKIDDADLKTTTDFEKKMENVETPTEEPKSEAVSSDDEFGDFTLEDIGV